MAETIKIDKSAPLSRWMTILGWLGMLIFAFHACTHMVGAGDTWVAMTCGRHFANHGVGYDAVSVEPFSANSHISGPNDVTMAEYAKKLRTTLQDRKNPPQGLKRTVLEWWLAKVENYPNWSENARKIAKNWHPTGWVNQNWLTHLIFYKLVGRDSYADGISFTSNALVYWKFTIYIITVICVYYTARILGAHPALCAVFACFAMFAGRSFLDVRPAGFSNMLVAVFLLILVLATYRNILYIWLTVPLTVFWCNVHGGYIYVFIVLVTFVGVNFLTAFAPKSLVSIGRRGLYHTIAVGFVTFIATILFNPYHLTNLTHTFVISFSRHAKMWRTVNEWHSAFEWTNPVGTSQPFLVLFMLCIGLVILWLFSRSVKPRLLKAPKNELDAQEKRINISLQVFGCASALLICWVTFIGFSFINNDFVSFLVCASFLAVLLLAACKNVHFIYMMVPLILLLVWTADPAWFQKAPSGYSGRYIYPFVLLPSYVILHITASLFSKKIKFKSNDIVFVILTAVAVLILMTVLFNPFKFESIWDVGQLAHIRRIWRPAYEGKEALGYANLFPVLYTVNVVSVIAWLLFPYLRSWFDQLPHENQRPNRAQVFQLPKMDFSLMAVTALTVYMAVRSRRFIPIAAIAACPVLAMFTDQMFRTISATRNFYKKAAFCVSPVPYSLKVFSTIAGAIAVLAFGAWWGLKFKRIYLNPWPTDTKLNTVFIRMTASDAKPFYALKFIKDNNLEGKMFNYWTEGGFIAWGQNPDPGTGKTPLRLFMDGRAQAAYDPKAYTLWTNIMRGGKVADQIVLSARARKRKLSNDDYLKIGHWINQQLKDRHVWIALMPASEFNSTFVKALKPLRNWQLAFFNNRQKLFVDVESVRGYRLMQSIKDKQAVFPDDFSKNLMYARMDLLFSKTKQERERGFRFAVEAFKLNPSLTPMQEVRLFSRFSDLRPRVDDFCENYLNEFIENKKIWAGRDGYNDRITAALLAADYLRQVARLNKDVQRQRFYEAKAAEFNEERKKILLGKRW